MRAVANAFSLTIACALFFSPRAAFAYRPFDGTDADVAEEGSFELELGPVHYFRQNGASYVIAPATVLNLGIFPGAELVVDSKNFVPNEASSSAPRFQLLDQDVLVKWVLLRGALQGERGISAAVEAGPLIPGVHGDDGFGASANLILSDQWKPVTLHWNNMLSDTRAHDGDFFSSLIIVGGPSRWALRPVAEIFGERTFGKVTTASALLGAIWRAHRTIDLDFGFREARVDSAPEQEIRIGFTWRIDLWGKKEAETGDE